MSLRLSLTPEVQGQFEAAATAADTSIAEQVRWRAEWLLALEPVDKPTLDLMASIARMAADIERETGASWHTHAGTHATLRQAILSRLRRLKPGGDTVFGPRPHRTESYDDPQQLGMWREFHNWQTRDMAPAAWWGLRRATEKTYQESMELQQHREREGGDDEGNLL